jgi:hypothetical protein
MLYPDDPAGRDREIETATVQHEVELAFAADASRERFIELALRGVNAPAPKDLRTQGETRIGRGYGAGMILYNACLRAHRAEKNVMTRSTKEIGVALFGGHGTRSNHTNNEVWSETKFRPVAHFWSALIWFEGQFGEPKELPCGRSHLPLFLKTADEFRRIAQSTKIPYRKGVLAAGEAVQIADDVRELLPAGTLSIC